MVIRRILILNDGRDKILKVLQYSAKLALYLNIVDRLVALYLPRLRRAAPSLTFSPSPTEKAIDGTPLLIAALRPDPAADAVRDHRARLEKLASHFSLARKTVRLFHALEPTQSLHDLLLLAAASPSPLWFFAGSRDRLIELVACLVGIANDAADDLICWSKMGVLGPAWAKAMTPVADRLWFASIFIDARDVVRDRAVARRKLAALRGRVAVLEKMEWAAGSSKASAALDADAAADAKRELKDLYVQRDLLLVKLRVFNISMAKLLMDFVFCSIDVFDLNAKLKLSDGFQIYSGLAAALLGSWKLFIKCK
ncbi:hypothetical protein DFJ73DRAFT_569960 [Zopfochytrium polystomum]|nr:hypothetical protein DFJ73DRAFT_569960 [Zopfochytrium polystomum]